MNGRTAPFCGPGRHSPQTPPRFRPAEIRMVHLQVMLGNMATTHRKPSDLRQSWLAAAALVAAWLIVAAGECRAQVVSGPAAGKASDARSSGNVKPARKDSENEDDRWRRTDTGRFFSGTIRSENQTTSKGIAIRVGGHQEAAWLFDTDLLRFACAWSGKFLEISPTRFGLGEAPLVAGFERFQTPVMPGDNRSRWGPCRASGPVTVDSIGTATA
jgi:hypothetical protein